MMKRKITCNEVDAIENKHRDMLKIIVEGRKEEEIGEGERLKDETETWYWLLSDMSLF